MVPQFRPLVVFAAAAAWLGLAVGGLTMLATYESKAGPATIAPMRWPASCALPREREYTLVVAVHPQCPCTRATMDELALLLARCPELGADVVFIQPKAFSESWAKSGLWARAQAMPRVNCVLDPDGALAAKFNAKTSGQVALYSHDGRLLFEGGLTASRGHAGDNAGLDSIVAITQHQTPAMTKTDVFGCALVNGASQ